MEFILLAPGKPKEQSASILSAIRFVARKGNKPPSPKIICSGIRMIAYKPS